ncbi:TolC family outer membrane protein [Roseovarius autotrophicus]|uniref:TolC family outer membrane protein n=1 Tax=Roseovarius autotrophicus TaxID=2824121 RepID=UPI001A0CD7A1|nr:TolC family outer membrane protein [Roseovarius sp.]
MLGLAGLVLVGTLGAARAETLGDALRDAYINSGLLQQNRALLRAADEDVAQAVAALRPIIDWTAGITRDFNRVRSGSSNTFNPGSNGTAETTANVGFTASLLLYDFGRSDFLTEAAKETVLATRETLRSVEQLVLLTAVQAYMDVIRNREFVDLRRNNLRLLQEELRAANDRFEVGEVTRTDVAQAEAAVALAQSGLAVAEGDLARAIEEFREAVGRDPGALRAPGDLPSIGDNLDAAKSAAMRRHPDILGAQRNVTVAELNVNAAAAAKRPSVNLTGRLGANEELTGQGFSRGGSVGVELRGPIYQGGRISSLERQARAQRDAQLARLHLAGLQVKQDVGNAYANLRAARAARAANIEGVRAAQVAFDGTREEARLGARTTLDVLDSEQNLLDAQANLISANADVVTAAYFVLAAIGELTAQDLNLGVQIYDPAAYYDLVKTAPVPISPQGQKLDRVLRALGKQ